MRILDIYIYILHMIYTKVGVLPGGLTTFEAMASAQGGSAGCAQGLREEVTGRPLGASVSQGLLQHSPRPPGI